MPGLAGLVRVRLGRGFVGAAVEVVEHRLAWIHPGSALPVAATPGSVPMPVGAGKDQPQDQEQDEDPDQEADEVARPEAAVHPGRNRPDVVRALGISGRIRAADPPVSLRDRAEDPYLFGEISILEPKPSE